MVGFSLEPGQLLPLSTLPVSLPVLGRYNAASGSLRYGAQLHIVAIATWQSVWLRSFIYVEFIKPLCYLIQFDYKICSEFQ